MLLPIPNPILDEVRKTEIVVTAGPVFGQETLGSEDTRRGGHYGVSLQWPEKRLAVGSTRAVLAVEVYYMFTKGGGFEDIPVNAMRTFGATASARYALPWFGGDRFRTVLGIGLCYNSIKTRDLDTNLNSTPFVGLDYEFDRYIVTARLFHMSNGGTGGNNQGQNQLQFLLGIKL